MGTLYLVRHGQASFGEENYDQLSDLGYRQSQRLGQYWRHREIRFHAVLTGTLQRHAQTWQGIAEGGDIAAEAQRLPELNEYDPSAVIQTVHPQPLAKPNSPELYRQHFRLLRLGLTQWMLGNLQPLGMPTWTEFQAGVTRVLDHVRQNCEGNVLLVSSGGPIATAIGHVLAAPTTAIVELNMRIRNSAISEFNFTPKRHSLMSYNTLPHLDSPELANWVTYA